MDTDTSDQQLTLPSTKDEPPWTRVGPSAKEQTAITIITRLHPQLDLRQTDTQDLGLQILTAARLTRLERGDTYIKVRRQQNLIAIDTYRAGAAEKLLAVAEIDFKNSRLHLNSYRAVPSSHARGVIHGIPPSDADGQLRETVELEQGKLLAVRRLGSSNTILLTVDSPTLPRYAFVNRVAYRIHLHKPKACQCTHCLLLGHRIDDCPNKALYTPCATCGQHFPPDTDPARMDHSCTPTCANCQGSHNSTDPLCPARREADHRRQEATNARRKSHLNPGQSSMKHAKPSLAPLHTPPTNGSSVWTSNRFTPLQDIEYEQHFPALPPRPAPQPERDHTQLPQQQRPGHAGAPPPRPPRPAPRHTMGETHSPDSRGAPRNPPSGQPPPLPTSYSQVPPNSSPLSPLSETPSPGLASPSYIKRLEDRIVQRIEQTVLSQIEHKISNHIDKLFSRFSNFAPPTTSPTDGQAALSQILAELAAIQDRLHKLEQISTPALRKRLGDTPQDTHLPPNKVTVLPSTSISDSVQSQNE